MTEYVFGYGDDPFPEDIDADGDGIIYYLFPADRDGDYDNAIMVDGGEYIEWADIPIPAPNGRQGRTKRHI